MGAGCVGVGNVVHELMHTVGVWHTQARMDRDQHVMVEWDNIEVCHVFSYSCGSKIVLLVKLSLL